ncbi:YopX family protein [Bacillus paramycoides]|uniref:YopX family protein n=1 Tax=Bacillus paramycoides TaxID=2026194 RepID=UPI002E226B0D|nr:YopX family protein [Bacillus paramycoides]
MKGIKFRLYQKLAKKMMPWEQAKGLYKLDVLDDNEESNIFSSWMQYTGIKDAHRKGIYEGDIAYQEFYDRISEKHGFTGGVKQSEGAWWICNGMDHAELWWSEINLNHIKGNKYDNPELLENLTK